MKEKYFHTSVTRTANLEAIDYQVKSVPRANWQRGDFVVGEINPAPSSLPIELSNGRMTEVAEGDLIVGAFGKRYATLEATGNWEAISSDGQMHALTGAGLLGLCESRTTLLPPLLSMKYRGHVHIDGKKAGMTDFVLPVSERAFNIPVVLITGTSMSAGKTTVARVVIRLLKKAGVKVVGAKLTGAGRYRDILSMQDAGADHIVDFVEAGLPSTICSEETFRKALHHMLSKMAHTNADVAVIEIGASPLEPYNGAEAIEALKDHIECVILCSSDPYAVVGVMAAFKIVPDLVAGITTSTIAGRELVGKLTGVKALNVINRQSQQELSRLLREQVLEKLVA